MNEGQEGLKGYEGNAPRRIELGQEKTNRNRGG